MFVNIELDKTICDAYIKKTTVPVTPSGGVTIRDWCRVIPDAGSVIGQRAKQNSHVIYRRGKSCQCS